MITAGEQQFDLSGKCGGEVMYAGWRGGGEGDQGGPHASLRGERVGCVLAEQPGPELDLCNQSDHHDQRGDEAGRDSCLGGQSAPCNDHARLTGRSAYCSDSHSAPACERGDDGGQSCQHSRYPDCVDRQPQIVACQFRAAHGQEQGKGEQPRKPGPLTLEPGGGLRVPVSVRTPGCSSTAAAMTVHGATDQRLPVASLRCVRRTC